MPPRTSIVAKVPAAPAVSSVATRLKTFGLSAAKLQLTNDLEVPTNQTVTLDAADQKLSKQLSRLTPNSIDDLKEWLGVPDAAFAHSAAAITRPIAIMPVHEAYTPDQSATLYSVARDYVFGNSSAVSKSQVPALNAWLKSIAGAVSIITFQDIHVAAGPRLVVNPSITVLFARYITIDQGGVIQVRCTHGAINCAGIKGAAPRLVPTAVGHISDILNQ